MNKIKRAFSSNEEDESNIVTEITDVTTLSWSTRIKCFAVCFVVGVTLSLLGAAILWTGNMRLFAALYSLGSVLAILSSLFLMGPMKQLKNMFKEKRWIATTIMLLSIALTLCAAFWWKKKGLALIFCIIQYFAMFWYTISYIPFARDAIKKCIGSCLG